jgi:lipopolysaccharide/colanic/teichoic acid biosynthesis glycosyltransferase
MMNAWEPAAAARQEIAPAGGSWKRALDVMLAAPAVLVLSPLLAVIAIAVRLESPGPALFRQERVGYRGTRFEVLKFRSMRVDASEKVHVAEAAAWFAGTPSGDGYKSIRDPRITRVGRFLRRTSADELPQLFNVLRGEMSLVGPRPGIPYELAHYKSWYFQRLAARPGMTGLWQVSGRELRSAAEMMELDVQYVRTCSLKLDLLVVVLTIPALLGFAPGNRLLLRDRSDERR